MCCRLAAQPHCMTQQMMSGSLKVKVSARSLILLSISVASASSETQFHPTQPIPFSVLPHSSWVPTPRVAPKSTPFSKEQVCSATTGRKTWRPAWSLLSPSLSTRSVKETQGGGGGLFHGLVLFRDVDPSLHKLRFVFGERASSAPSLAAEESGSRGTLPVFISCQLVDLEQKKSQ